MKARHAWSPSSAIPAKARIAASFGRSAAIRAASLRAKGTGAPSSRLALAPLLAALALFALALSASAALAAQTHVFAASFGSEGSGAGQLNEPIGIAVDQQSHDVYVADTGNNRFDKFGLAGTFIGGLLTGAPA